MTSEAQPRKRGGAEILMINTEDNSQDEEPNEASPLMERHRRGDEDDAEGDDDGRRKKHGSDIVDDFEGMPWWKRPSVYWLIAPFGLFSLAFGGIMVPKLDLIVSLVCRQYFAEQQLHNPDFVFTPVVPGGENPQCNSAAVQKLVSVFTLVLSVLTGGLSALVAPKLGALSDRHGRKRLMVVASCGGVASEVVTIFAAKFPDAVDYRWMVLGAFFDGATGSFTAGMVLANSYTSDCAPPSRRGVYMGYLHACLFTGLAFGPILAGYFVNWTGSLISLLYVVLGCHLTVIMYWWFVLPESLSKKRRMIAREKHQADMEAVRSALPSQTEHTLGSWLPAFMTDTMGNWLPVILSANPLAPLKILVPSGRQNKPLRRNLVLLAFIDTIIMGAAMGTATVVVLYSKYMFGWGTLEASRFVSIVSMVRVAILLGVFPVVNHYFRLRPMRRKQQQQQQQLAQQEGGQQVSTSGNSTVHAMETNSGADTLDIWLLRLALLSDVAGIVGYVFVRTPQLFVLSGAVTAFGGLAGATIQSAVTKHVPAERVGALLGAMGLLHALGRVFAPILFNGLYAATIETFPQAFFVVLASLLGTAVLASLFIRPHLYLKEDGYVTVPVRDPGSPTGIDILQAEEEMPGDVLPRV
ncbi:MFS general substrate transporter [Xylariaceae sp. FL0804]|nr:MFS general substrate transporter [Xylariaceae sp. FL0804]